MARHTIAIAISIGSVGLRMALCFRKLKLTTVVETHYMDGHLGGVHLRSAKCRNNCTVHRAVMHSRNTGPDTSWNTAT